MSVWDTSYYVSFPKNCSIITIKDSMLSGKVNVNVTTTPVLLALFSKMYRPTVL